MLTTASFFANPLAGFAMPVLQDHSWASAAEAVQRAGLVDLDFTVIIQAVLFFTLLALLPSLILKPLVARFDQREARTEGARNDAKALRKQADEQVTTYEHATQEQRKKAMAERADTRAATQRQADALVAQARAETQARIDAGLVQQRQVMKQAQGQLDAIVVPLARGIADKFVQG